RSGACAYVSCVAAGFTVWFTPMCCPRVGDSRGVKGKARKFISRLSNHQAHLAAADIAVAQSLDKPLKFLDFVHGEIPGPALGLEHLQSPAGRLVRQLEDRRPQFARGGCRPGNDLFAGEEFLKRLTVLM